MDAKQLKFDGGTNRRGSALIMAVVLTVLLALIASLFMLTSRIDEMATKSIQQDKELDAAVNILVDKIGNVLTQDVCSSTGQRMLETSTTTTTPSNSNEQWDYPSTDDPWLACLEPTIINGVPSFRRISDIDIDPTNDDLYTDFKAAIIKSTDTAGVGNIADADGDGVSDSRWIQIPGIKSQKSKDGKSVPIYAAVRIIDNSAMINANTAYRNPQNIAIPGNWDGSQLSHVNLEGITNPDPANRLDAADIQLLRYGSVANMPLQWITSGASDFYDVLNDREYESNVARRLFDPEVIERVEYINGQPVYHYFHYLPFDISDELELRNRFFLTTSYRKIGTKTRLGLAWPATFNPQADPGKGLPYGSNSTDTIASWYSKVGPDGIGSSNRRHYTTIFNSDMPGIRAYDPANITDFNATAYMNDATVTPLNPQQKIGITLPKKIDDNTAADFVKENFITRLAMGIYRGLPEASVLQNRFDFNGSAVGGNFDLREETAWQMAVNMVDYQDASSLPTKIELPTVSDPNTKAIYYGTEDLETLKKNTVCISKIGYYNKVSTPTDSSVDGKYFAIEIFNPDDTSDKSLETDLGNYKVIITDANGFEKYQFPLDDVSGANPNPASLVKSFDTGANDTLVYACNWDNPSMTTANIASTLVGNVDRFIKPSVPFSFEEGYKVIVYNTYADMPVDSVTIPANMIIGNDLEVRFRQAVLPGTHFLLPCSANLNPWMKAYGSSPAQLGEDLDASSLDENPLPSPYPESHLRDPSSAWLPELENIGVQLAGKNAQLSNIGEIENVLAVGTRYIYDPVQKKHDVTTFIQAIVNSAETILDLGAASEDLTLDQEDGIEMISFGRINLTDPIYWSMLDSLTYFDPARDGVDLLNIAERATINITGTVFGADPETLIDGKFLPSQTPFSAGTDWDDGTVYWTDPVTRIGIDLDVAYDVYGAIIQADGDDDYTLEYYDYSESRWKKIWAPSNLAIQSMQTSPDVFDNARWHLFEKPVNTDRFRISASNSSVPQFSLSEIQLAVKNDPVNDNDPYYYGDNIAGRVNINTAPWYVIAQLPWVEGLSDDTNPYALAQAIVAYRDKTTTPDGNIDYSGMADKGFKNIAELTQVINELSATDPAMAEYDIRKNIFDGTDAQPENGDFTEDGIADDFEERNLIFQRISNLVTVRSDVFTAYIAVRIGSNGPERRMIAIFDRSSVNSAKDKPKLLAIHQVPDPR